MKWEAISYCGKNYFYIKTKTNTQNVLINKQTRPTFESEIVYKNKNQLNLKGYVMILIEPKMTE